MTKVLVSLQNEVANTLMLTLYARAIESQHAHPILYDEYAIQMVEQIDYDFSIFENISTTSAGVAIRSKHFDHICRQFIEAHAQPIVVVLGCGLDTRKQRLEPISDQAVFIQLDLEEVIALRERLLPMAASEQYIAANILDTHWMDQLRAQYPQGDFLFIIEGVLMYLTKEENQQFFYELAERFIGAELHFDLFNRWMSQNTALHEGVNRTQASFKFGLNNSKLIENWHPHLKQETSWLLNDFPEWYRMGLPFVSLYLLSYPVRTACKFLKFTIRQPTHN
ncbi:hypothetical protein AAEX37_01473 [Oligella sp. MSHR50489EDL]|uniref:class I SAM-dependent methyltransferase n=1 Tax=Oligella sp. MSHR50489EDL TaxID=3139409 RepID=UPI003D819FBC